MPYVDHVPEYRLHRASDQAIVSLNGRDCYLGPWKSTASRVEYDRLIGEWLTAGRHLVGSEGAGALTVNECLLRYWEFAKQHDRTGSGRRTTEIGNLRDALWLLLGRRGSAKHQRRPRSGTCAMRCGCCVCGTATLALRTSDRSP